MPPPPWVLLTSFRQSLQPHYFDFLLGDGLQERKNFIAENGAKYLELADIS